jgi:hypothetical protein
MPELDLPVSPGNVLTKSPIVFVHISHIFHKAIIAGHAETIFCRGHLISFIRLQDLRTLGGEHFSDGGNYVQERAKLLTF